LAGALLFDEKIRQSAALFWLGLWDVRIRQIFFSQAIIQEQLMTLPHFWWKRSWFVPIQPMCRISRRIRGIFYEAAQNFDSFQILKTEFLKSKTYSG
jgi:hypothetical protein